MSELERMSALAYSALRASGKMAVSNGVDRKALSDAYAERDAAQKLAEHYRSTLVEMSKDGCGYAGIWSKPCLQLFEDRNDWCWCCVATKALEEKP